MNTSGKHTLWKLGKILAVALLVLGAAVLGFVARGGRRAETPEKQTAETKAETIWTCSMHPQIHLPKPGKCPICSMDLIPLAGGSGADRTFVTSEAGKKLMDIQTAPAERRFVSAEIRMVGKVEYDETRLRTITAWVPGRLDRLFVDYTGVPVRKGDHLVEIYSPELLAAQEELLRSLKTVRELEASGVEIVREASFATVEAVREKLRLWGLTAGQVAEIESRGTASDRVTIFAPAAGIVVEKLAQEGVYVKTGSPVYRLADLSALWVKLDAYESDLAWLRYGQDVTISAGAYPGEEFHGRISFIDPALNEKTRTVKVRVNVPNDDGRLKPGMFVHSVVKSMIGAGGRAMEPALAGKWICPMHPEVVKDETGACDVCGMPLVRAETLGYVGVEPTDSEKPLVIPASAPLITGKRAVVYVAVPGAEKPTFEGREIVLGPRAGDFYLVRQGLREGERVVTNGNFKIDSALQIQARPSMMSADPHEPASEAPAPTGAPVMASPEFQKQLAGLWSGYLAVQSALAADNAAATAAAAQAMRKALGDVNMTLLSGKAHEVWMTSHEALSQVLDAMAQAEGIAEQREHFARLSTETVRVIRTFGLPSDVKSFRLHCPMAFDGRGADWLQSAETVENPYFGEVMLRCGEVVETLSPVAEGGTHE